MALPSGNGPDTSERIYRRTALPGRTTWRSMPDRVASKYQNDPNVVPTSSTTTSASSGPTTDTMNMSK